MDLHMALLGRHTPVVLPGISSLPYPQTLTSTILELIYSTASRCPCLLNLAAGLPFAPQSPDLTLGTKVARLGLADHLDWIITTTIR